MPRGKGRKVGAFEHMTGVVVEYSYDPDAELFWAMYQNEWHSDANATELKELIFELVDQSTDLKWVPVIMVSLYKNRYDYLSFNRFNLANPIKGVTKKSHWDTKYTQVDNYGRNIHLDELPLLLDERYGSSDFYFHYDEAMWQALEELENSRALLFQTLYATLEYYSSKLPDFAAGYTESLLMLRKELEI